jgi:cbb3-type cytochrome oxidase maturation protein
MDSLYLLLPLSVLLVLALIGVFAWALHSDQFDDLEREGWRVLEDEPPVAQSPRAVEPGRSLPRPKPDPDDPEIPLSG